MDGADGDHPMSPLIRWGDEPSPRGRVPLAAGHLPPLKVTQRMHTHGDCGTTFRPTAAGVSRWGIEGRVLWLATCPGCHSLFTVHETEAPHGD
jgi:hypothetical protein